MEIHQEHWAIRHIKEIVIALIITTLVTMVGSLTSLYLTYRLSPLAETDRRIESDVQALFEGDLQRREDHDKITTLDSKLEGIEQNVNDIKKDVQDIRNYLLK